MNEGLYKKFTEYLDDRITSSSQTVLSGNLDMETYKAECAKILALRSAKEEFLDLWERAMRNY